MKDIEIYYTSERKEVAFYIGSDAKTILDVGCGEGNFLKFLKQQTGAETWGIEVEEKVADIAKSNVDKIIIATVEEAMEKLPDNYFDYITFNDVLEHLMDPTEVLNRIKVKLKTEGKIIASIPNVRYFYNLIELTFKKDWEYKEEGILDSTHLRFFTYKSMLRMFNHAGYEVIKQNGINRLNTRRFRIFNLLTFGYFNDTGYLQFICIAKKLT